MDNIFFTLFLSLFCLLHFVLVCPLYILALFLSFVVACFDYHKSPPFSLVAITIAMLVLSSLFFFVLNYATYDILLGFVSLIITFFFALILFCIPFIKWSLLFPTYTLIIIWLKIQRVTHTHTYKIRMTER